MLLSPTKNSYSLPLKALPSPLLFLFSFSVLSLTGFRWKYFFQSTICRLLEWQTSFTVIVTAPEQTAQSLLSLCFTCRDLTDHSFLSIFWCLYDHKALPEQMQFWIYTLSSMAIVIKETCLCLRQLLLFVILFSEIILVSKRTAF